MDLNPFAAIKDYSSMLNKIALFTFVGAIANLFVLAHTVPEVKNLLAWFPRLPVPLAGASLPLGYVVIAFAVAFASRVFKLHALIADIFGIRRRFALAAILMPIALTSGIALTLEQIRALRHGRGLMTKLFYKYAGGPADKAKIPEHYITLALDQWSWYWIIEEEGFLLLAAGLIAFSTSQFLLAALYLLALLVVIEVLNLMWDSRVAYALNQVEQIVSDTQRRIEIAEVINAL
jgi:hypothetical protein